MSDWIEKLKRREIFVYKHGEFRQPGAFDPDPLWSLLCDVVEAAEELCLHEAIDAIGRDDRLAPYASRTVLSLAALKAEVEK